MCILGNYLTNAPCENLVLSTGMGMGEGDSKGLIGRR